MISVEDSIKKALDDVTSNHKKALVEYEINGWLETYKKISVHKGYLKQDQIDKHVFRSLENLNCVMPQGGKDRKGDLVYRKREFFYGKKQELVSGKKTEIEEKRSGKNSFSINNRAKVGRKDNQQNQNNKSNLQNQNNQNAPESANEVKKINLQVSDCHILKPKTKCNSRGYVLKQLRRKLKQKSQLKNYTLNNDSCCPQVERKMEIEEEFEFLQKRIRMVLHSSRSARPIRN